MQQNSAQTYVFTRVYTNRLMTHDASVDDHFWRSSAFPTLPRKTWKNNYHPQHVLNQLCDSQKHKRSTRYFHSGVCPNQEGFMKYTRWFWGCGKTFLIEKLKPRKDSTYNKESIEVAWKHISVQTNFKAWQRATGDRTMSKPAQRGNNKLCAPRGGSLTIIYIQVHHRLNFQKWKVPR